MKRIILITIVLLLLAFTVVNAAFCCRDRTTDQEKCYDSGECCGGYWYPACFGFEVDVSGPNVLRVGQKTPITVYIENTGGFSDDYVITTTPSDNRIIVDMTGAETAAVDPHETKVVYPRVTILAPVTGSVTFTVSSVEAGMKSDTYNILETDFYHSLPEFSILFLILSMSLIGIIYFLRRESYF